MYVILHVCKKFVLDVPLYSVLNLIHFDVYNDNMYVIRIFTNNILLTGLRNSRICLSFTFPMNRIQYSIFVSFIMTCLKLKFHNTYNANFIVNWKYPYYWLLYNCVIKCILLFKKNNQFWKKKTSIILRHLLKTRNYFDLI